MGTSNFFLLEKATLWNQNSVNFFFQVADYFYLAFENIDMIHTNIFETIKAILMVFLRSL